jgi:predicted nuclease of predicted toxin-antitoxin system
LNLLLDMNLVHEWQHALGRHGFNVRHWRDIGDISAPDAEILRWAREHEDVVITKDLDLPQLLFAARARKPSVVLLRIRDTLNRGVILKVCAFLKELHERLEEGCLVVIDEQRARVRPLPIQRD